MKLLCTIVGFYMIFCLNAQDIEIKYLTDGEFYKTSKLKDPKLLSKNIEKELNQFYSEGYFGAAVDSIYQKDSLITVDFFLGQQSLTKINWIDLEEGISNEINSPKKKNRLNVIAKREKILKHYENNGYPFVQIDFEPKEFKNDSMFIDARIDKGELIFWDTIRLVGTSKLRRKFLQNYLDIKTGEVYSEKTLKSINKKIRNSAFSKSNKPAKVVFVNQDAYAVLDLKPSKASQFDFILGVLPNNQNDGKLLLTGEAKLNLLNPFGTGKSLNLEWRRLRPGTQELQTYVNYPYVLGLPFGVDANFDLYKNDTLFLELKRGLGIQYLFSGQNYLRAFFQAETVNILTTDTTFVKQNLRLPNQLDVTENQYGLEFNYENVDYRFNPTKGFTFNLKSAVGLKKVKRNNAISNLNDASGFDYNSLYDTLKVNKLLFEIGYQQDYYLRFTPRIVLHQRLQGKALINKNSLFQNEFYRIGGARIMRGFDDGSLLSSMYHIGTLELRYILGLNSYFQLFADQAYVERKASGISEHDFPLGFGAGITFETKVGIFELNYALGRQNNDPIRFKNAKVHFGYLNYF